MVTERREDLVPALAWLTRHLIPFPAITPGESHNNLLSRNEIGELLSMLPPGEEIPLGARLFSIVDAVDAITCHRPYRPARVFDTAFHELEKGSGSQFDPSLVDLFLSLPKEKLLSIRDRFLAAE